MADKLLVLRVWEWLPGDVEAFVANAIRRYAKDRTPIDHGPLGHKLREQFRRNYDRLAASAKLWGREDLEEELAKAIGDCFEGTFDHAMWKPEAAKAVEVLYGGSDGG